MFRPSFLLRVFFDIFVSPFFDIQAQPYLQARLQGRRRRLLRERFGVPKQGA